MNAHFQLKLYIPLTFRMYIQYYLKHTVTVSLITSTKGMNSKN